MNRRRSRIKLVLFLVVLTALAVFLWRPIQQARAVAAVQDSLDRAWEITFQSSHRPDLLPEFLDDAARDLLGRMFYSTLGYDGSTPAKERNRDEVHHARLHGLFRGPIEFVGIYYPEGFRGEDLGTALARFPRLRRFEVYENESTVPTEADWTRLCTKLQSLPNLAEIELGGAQVTDAVLSRLAGHPGLGSIEISYSRITAGCAATFATMPRLRELKIGESADKEFSQDLKDAIIAALPKVKVVFE